ncbi:hypothetical protein LINPERHAP1_LOCUS16524 [Linum perenne]
MLRLQKEGGMDFDLSLGNIKAILVVCGTNDHE